MDWGYNSYNYSIKNKVKELLSRIRQLESLGKDMLKHDRFELNELKKELEQKQKECSHTWEVVQLLITCRQYCEYCQVENSLYNHFEHNIK